MGKPWEKYAPVQTPAPAPAASSKVVAGPWAKYTTNAAASMTPPKQSSYDEMAATPQRSYAGTAPQWAAEAPIMGGRSIQDEGREALQSAATKLRVKSPGSKEVNRYDSESPDLIGGIGDLLKSANFSIRDWWKHSTPKEKENLVASLPVEATGTGAIARLFDHVGQKTGNDFLIDKTGNFKTDENYDPVAELEMYLVNAGTWGTRNQVAGLVNPRGSGVGLAKELAPHAADVATNMTMGLSDVGAAGVRGVNKLVNGLQPRPATPAAVATPQPSVAPVPQPTVAQPSAGAAQAGPTGAGQGASVAQPVLNATPVAPPISKVPGDTQKILTRILGSASVPRDDIEPLSLALVQAYEAFKSSGSEFAPRVSLGRFIDKNLAEVAAQAGINLPDVTVRDVQQGLRGRGRTAHGDGDPGDRSRAIMSTAIGDLRTTQKDFARKQIEAPDAFNVTAIADQKKALERNAESIGKEAYNPTLKFAKNVWDGVEPAKAGEREALEKLQQYLLRKPYLEAIPADLKLRLALDEIPLETRIAQDPAGTAHWLQSKLGQAAADSTDGGMRGALGDARERLLVELDKAIPAYKNIRADYGDEFRTLKMLDAGKTFFADTLRPADTADLADLYKAGTARQKTAMRMSVRDELFTVFDGNPEEAALRLEKLTSEGRLRGLEEIFGAPGKKVADTLRFIRDESLWLRGDSARGLQGVDALSGSNTIPNALARANDAKAVRTGFQGAISNIADRSRVWAAMLTDAAIAFGTGGAYHYPMLTMGAAGSKIARGLGNPSRQVMANATEGLFSLPNSGGNALKLPPPKPIAPRGPRAPKAPLPTTMRELQEAYQAATTRAERKRIQKQMAKVGAPTNALASPPSPPVKAGFGGSKPLDMSEAARMQRAREQGFDTERVAYRGLGRPYDESGKGGGRRYQMFTSSQSDAAEYGPHVVEAYLRKGNNLKLDGNGRNFNSVPVSQLPDDVRAKLHPSIQGVARIDDIADAAQKAGYDSVTVANVFDNAWGEIPTKPRPRTQKDIDLDNELLRELGVDPADFPSTPRAPEAPAKNTDPVTIDVVFDTKNIRSPNAAFDPSQSGSSKLLAGIGGSEGVGGFGGAVAGGALAPDANNDGVVDAQERAAGAFGGALSGIVGAKAVRAGGNALAKVGKAPSVERGPVRFGGKTDGAGPPSVSDRPWSVEDNRTALPPRPPVKAGFGGSSKPLPMDEASRMGRAREQGFDVDTPLYHGTAADFDQFDPHMRGNVNRHDADARRAFFLTTKPQIASQYADEAAYTRNVRARDADPTYQAALAEWNLTVGKKNWLGKTNSAKERAAFERLESAESAFDIETGAAVLPVYSRLKNPYVVTDIPYYDNILFREAIDYAKEQGHDGVIFRNVHDEVGKGGAGASDVYAVFDPKNIRGKFAAFDPSQSGSSKLLAGMGASPEAVGAIGGGAAGYALAPDQNGDGVVDAQERAAGGLGGFASGIAGAKILRGAGNALRNTTPPKGPPSGPAQQTFGGVKAKTADLKLQRIAQDMEKAGASRDQIWKETGWFKGNDGKWRFEIDDSKAGFNAATKREFDNKGVARVGKGPDGVALKTAFNHSEAGKAYPQYSWTALKGEIRPGKSMGGTHQASPYRPDGPGSMRFRAGNVDDAREIVLHEGQHGVQGYEDFARGGSPGIDMIDDVETIGNAYNNTGRPWNELDGNMQDNILREAAMDRYRRLAGEVEARNVQTRRDFTPEERRARPPWTTQDVPDDQQIVRFNSGEARREPTPPRSITIASGKADNGKGYTVTAEAYNDRGRMVLSPEWPTSAFDEMHAARLKRAEELLYPDLHRPKPTLVDENYGKPKPPRPEWEVENPKAAAEIGRKVADRFVGLMNADPSPVHVLALKEGVDIQSIGEMIERGLPKNRQIFIAKDGGEIAVVDKAWHRQNPQEYTSERWNYMWPGSVKREGRRYGWKDGRPTIFAGDAAKPTQAGFLPSGSGKPGAKPPANALAGPPKPKPVEARREAPRGTKSFSDPRLSPGENKTAEMVLNGYTYDEIADEAMTSVDVIKRQAMLAQRKLGDDVKLPRPGMGKRPPGSTKRDAANSLFGEGLDNATIAQRTGLSLGNVRTYRSYWKEQSKAPVASVEGAAYNPPAMPERPFEADYPQKDWPDGPPVDAQGRLTRDMDRKPLDQSSVIIGRNKAPGYGAGSEADRSLRDRIAIIQTIKKAGSSLKRVPRSPDQTSGAWGPKFNDKDGYTGRGVVQITDDLDRPIAGLDDQEVITLSHELAHSIDFKAKPARDTNAFNERAWGIDHKNPDKMPPESVAKVQGQLERVYQDLNNPVDGEVKIRSPRDHGYEAIDADRELWAEAIRAYMWDPNYIKTVAPDVAFMIRHHVNRNSSLRKTIQFNAIPTIVGVGGLGLGAAALNGQPAEAKTRSSGMRANALAPAQNNRP